MRPARRRWICAAAVAQSVGLCACRADTGARLGELVVRALPSAAASATPPGGAPAPRPPPSALRRAELPAKTGYRPVTVAGVWFVHERHVVILLDSASQLAVPIFIGPSEALSIELRLDGRRFERPLTHDLYDATLERLGGAVERVTIDRLQEDTFHATVVIRTSADRFALDARSSDAIALALGAQAPIEVADAVVRRAGVDLAALEAHSHGELAPREPRAPEEVPLGL